MKKRTITLLTLALLMLTGNTFVNAQRVTVSVAGNGTAGYSGDGWSSNRSVINGPNDVCMDAAQNLYFVDKGNNVIRKVSAATGIISTYAGGGTSIADGVPAISASLYPNYLCIDAANNLYVSTNGNQVRKIDGITGIITTVAGSGSGGFGGDGGFATAASLDGPQGICIDAAGNIYIVDEYNYRIRMVTAAGIISTIAGSGAPGYSGDGGSALLATMSQPMAICVNSSTGNVYFSDQYGNYIREIEAATGLITHIAGIPGGAVAGATGGPAATTAIGQILGLHITADGDIYGCDESCSCVRIGAADGNIYLEAGSLSIDSYNGDGLNSLVEYFYFPHGLWVDATGNIYVADYMDNRIRKSIQLTHTPTFAYGHAQFMNACSASSPIDSQMTITDLDTGQTETWSVITAPMHGTLSGFPATVTSVGAYSTSLPTGVSYNLDASYTGSDSFQVMVSDGALSNIVTIYVSAGVGTLTGPSNVCFGSAISLSDDLAGGAWTMSNSNATISVSGLVYGMYPGSDTATYSLTNACGLVTSEKVITIDATVPTTAGTITGLSNVCAGSAITLTNTLGGGVWSASNPEATVSATGLVTGLTAGSDDIVYSVTNGCGTTTTAQTITINPMPDAGTIVSDAIVCIGTSITLTDAATGGIWSSGNIHAVVTSSGLVTGISAGTGTIQYAVTNTCGTATATQEITVNDCGATGVQSTTSSTPAVNIFPNPASSALNIAWEALQPGNASITITDVTGRVVLRNELTITGNGSTGLDVSEMQDGVYLVAFSSGSVHFTDKVVISK